MNASADLAAAASAVRDSVTLLAAVRPTMEAFLRECRNMESFGAVIRPELFRDPKRKRMSDAIEPLFQAAILLLESHNAAAVTLIEAALAAPPPVQVEGVT